LTAWKSTWIQVANQGLMLLYSKYLSIFLMKFNNMQVVLIAGLHRNQWLQDRCTVCEPINREDFKLQACMKVQSSSIPHFIK